jgi:ubiquinone/menaquinone biosynthesis C-methylase UbiE
MGTAKRSEAEAKPRGRLEAPDRFDSAAEDYDRWYQSPVNSFIDCMETRALEGSMPYATGLLLEVGCGTGHWFPLHKRKGYRVVGLDHSGGMLTIARNLDVNHDLVMGDAFNLPFNDYRFDIVCGITALEFMGDHVRALDEMYRCLKPGGVLIVGALNALSFLGIRRRLFPSPTFRGVHLFTVRELVACLERYGAPEVTTCAFMPPYRFFLPMGELLEAIGKRLFAGWGQLIVASVTKASGT